MQYGHRMGPQLHLISSLNVLVNFSVLGDQQRYFKQLKKSLTQQNTKQNKTKYKTKLN